MFVRKNFESSRGILGFRNYSLKNFVFYLFIRQFSPCTNFLVPTNEPNNFFCTAGLLTRNNSLDYEESKNSSAVQKKKIFDAIATASITSNLANVDTSRSSVISLSNFSKFLETKQCERLSEPEVISLIQVCEVLRKIRFHKILFVVFSRFIYN